jgi:hypothetical protein
MVKCVNFMHIFMHHLILQTVSNVIVHTDRHCLVYFWNQTRSKNIWKSNKGNTLKNLFSQFVNYDLILRDYYMTFSIAALVLARDSHIKLDSEAGGLIWVEGWYQGRYAKFYVIIYLSHILHWLFSSIDFIFLWRQTIYGKWVCLWPYMVTSCPPWVFTKTF